VREAIKYDCCPNQTFVTLRFDIRLRRRPLYYIIYMIAPISGVAFLALLTFCLPPDSGERIGFGL